jgi:hypothetical protein
MRYGAFLAALCLAALSNGDGLAAEYPAPNGHGKAVITDTSPTDCEFALEIHEANGQLGIRKDYRSGDHEHGGCLGMAQWTPDSRFFVFVVENAGGHQSWNSPIEFYSLRTRRILRVEAFIPDPITASGFEVFAPDEIEFETTRLPHDFANEPPKPIIRRLKLGTLEQQP